MKYANILVGDPAPYFRQRTYTGPNYNFESAAGRYLVLCFFGSASAKLSQEALDAVKARTDLFDDIKASFFGVSGDPSDERENRLQDRFPGYRFFFDFDLTASRLYGAAVQEVSMGTEGYLPRWVVVSPSMRIMKVVPFKRGSSCAGEVLSFLDGLPDVQSHLGMPLHAPIIVLPDVFEPEICQNLIDLYDQHGGQESGFMREIDGRTVQVNDPAHKRRKDYTITDDAVLALTRGRIVRRVIPEIKKVHQFSVTRMERYIVSCYAAEDNAHFGAHRDNTTKGTAHRQFAVSINLNDDFDGGEVSFPEYGPRSFKAPVGGAVIFSCSLLHAVSKVTRGKRYAFLPFLYDDAAARIRDANSQFIETKSAQPGVEKVEANPA